MTMDDDTEEFSQEDGMALLYALEDNLTRAEHMLENGVDVNAVFQYEDTLPLHHAVSYCSLQAVQLVLDYGADVDLTEPTLPWPTALHLAVYRDTDSYETCKVLLERGANPNEKDQDGATPLHNALKRSSLQVVRLLLDYRADITILGANGETALHFATVNRNNVDVLQFVLEQGLDMESGAGDSIVAFQDLSPLCFAVIYENPGGCKALLKHGAMVNRKGTRTGHSPFSLAICQKRTDDAARLLLGMQVVEVLLEYGAEVADKVWGKSILELAATGGTNGGIRNILVQHMAKMKHLNVRVNEEAQQIVENKDCYKEYYRKCLQEIEDMRSMKFYNDVSIFSIFLGSQKLIFGYARNEELVKALEENQYEDRFPIYFTSLKKGFHAIVEKQSLRDTAAHILSKIFNFNDPSHPVIRNIVSFLSDEDFKFLEM